jgi:hypothetical protein
MCGQRRCCGAKWRCGGWIVSANGTIIACSAADTTYTACLPPHQKEVPGMNATQLTSWACTRATGPCSVARFSKLLNLSTFLIIAKQRRNQWKRRWTSRCVRRSCVVCSKVCVRPMPSSIVHWISSACPESSSGICVVRRGRWSGISPALSWQRQPDPGRTDSGSTSLVMIAFHCKFGQILTQ